MKSNLILGVLVLLLIGNIKSQDVFIDFAIKKQYIRGFGGVNMPGWIGDLTSAQTDKAFGNGNDQLGFSILRIRVPYDTLQFYREVNTAKRAILHGAIVIASPWTPPAYMKTNNNIVGGKLDTAYYDDYAKHLLRFANYMADNGAPLFGISLQNEPDISVTYESCDWSADDMKNFVIKEGSKFDALKLIVAESYNFNHSMTDPILNDTIAEQYIDIIGGHIYGAGLKDYPLARGKGKEVWMTEHLDTDTTYAKVLETGKEIHDCMVANFNAYLWWYIRRFYGPINDAGNITKRGYIISQFSKFVRHGYSRVEATSNPYSNIYTSVFTNDTSIVIVVINKNATATTLNFAPANQIDNVISYSIYTTSKTKNLNYDGVVNANGNVFSVKFDAESVTTLIAKYNKYSDVMKTNDITITPVIYPNPFSDKAYLEFYMNEAKNINISITDIAGRTITTICNEIRQPGINRIIIDGSKLEKGIYFCRFEMDLSIKSLRFIKY
jgi:O-glycosyl hydrolase